jgi:hypothetical protein
MNATPRSVRIASIAIVSCSLVLPVSVAFAGEQAAPPQSAAAVEPPKAPPAPPPVAAAQPPAPLPLRTVHPQIAHAALAREYRSLPLTTSAPAISANEDTIRAALNDEVQQAAWRFVETPLRQVVAGLHDTIGVPVALDVKALDEQGVDLDTPVVFEARSGSVRSALRRMLDDLDLAWIVRDECLLITAQDKAEQTLVTRLYPLPFGYATDATAVDFQSIIDLLTDTVGGPGAWADTGGNGTIRPLDAPQVLVVTQTEALHAEIEGLLRSLHARGLEAFGVRDGKNATAPVVRVHPVADSKVRVDLANKIVGLCNASLPQGADPAAQVTIVGECLAVQSVSPEFHVLAGQLIRGVNGVEVPDLRGQPAGDFCGGTTARAAQAGFGGDGPF